MQYPLVEISTALIFLLISNSQFPIPNFNQLINIVFLFYIASSLIIILVYDLKFYLIPDKVLFPAIATAFIYRVSDLFRNWKLEIGNFATLYNFLLAAFIASTFFLVIYLISHGEWMGFGDVKLAILLGIILGFPNILLGLFLSFFFGAIIGIGLILLNRKGLKSEVPFAPFLILGTLTAMFFGNTIVQWYMSLLFNF